jgi:peptidoglycan/LPS O-acetylase OafA/YrhL
MTTGRLATLDAMRGVAALAVVQFHFEIVFRPQDRIAFGYLAVDLFFVLSGFVLAHSYGARLLAGMSRAEFLLRRVVRLAPLYLAALLGGMVVVQHTPLANSTPAWAPLFEIFMLPPLPLVADMPIVPALMPGWSLFFELYVANLLFTLRALRTSRLGLGLVVGASAALLVVAILAYGTLDIGSLGRNVWGGFPRVCLSFFAGVLVERLRRRHPPRWTVPSWLVLAVLAACLWCPLPGDGTAARVFEFCCVFLVFPGLVYLGATAQARYPRAGILLGDASYALYMIHFPLVIALAKRLIHAGLTADRLAEAAFIAATAVLAVFIARLLDEPLRGWLWRRVESLIRRHKPVPRPV